VQAGGKPEKIQTELRGTVMKITYSCILLLASALCAGMTAQAGERDRDQGLVLGDSVAFAYIASAGHAYINPENFLGFWNELGRWRGVEVTDAACPGETTGSFLSATAADNGCRAYRSAFPLHVPYSGTQLAFAKQFLKKNRDVRFVTITLGANDGFLLEDSCATQPNPTACIEAGVPALLAQVETNLATIIADLRGTGYGGAIIVTNYYSTDYSDASGTALTALLNGAISASAHAYGVRVADLFTAFEKVAANPAFGGKTCNAGLLNALASDQALCDVHPSQSGQKLIAETIARVLPWY
jgi:lysophospholipase L1-like esterase